MEAYREKFSCSVQVLDPPRPTQGCREAASGPRILFFSGGTALSRLSQTLIRYTHNSIHLVTPFDSGGSSAKLRQAFHMPSVGDIRNRLIALADRSIPGIPEVCQLFAFRFPRTGTLGDLRARLERIVWGNDPLVTR
ncbi:MAG: GAK system CofD-like protein, partial [Nitrospinota bacterium]